MTGAIGGFISSLKLGLGVWKSGLAYISWLASASSLTDTVRELDAEGRDLSKLSL